MDVYDERRAAAVFVRTLTAERRVFEGRLAVDERDAAMAEAGLVVCEQLGDEPAQLIGRNG